MKGMLEIFKEIKDDGIGVFLIVAIVVFLGFITFRSEERVDKQVTMALEERKQNNEILKQIAKSNEIMAGSQKELVNMYKMYESRLNKLEMMSYTNGANINIIQDEMGIKRKIPYLYTPETNQ